MDPNEARAIQLAEDATSLIDKGETDAAKRAINEAVSIAPSNPAVKTALTHVRRQENGGKVVVLCQSWFEQSRDPASEKIGEEALRIIALQPMADESAIEAFGILLKYSEASDICDQMTYQLLLRPLVKVALAKEIVSGPTPLFRRLFARGDDTVVSLLGVLQDPTVWPSSEVRVAAVRDIFQLALSMAMEAGLEHPERSMWLISRLLAGETENLTGLMDADGFNVLLDCLDVREAPVVRYEATVAITTLIDYAPESAYALIAQYITPKVETPTTNTLVRAFSAATAVFPSATAPAVTLFLSEGFLPKFVALCKSKNSTTLTSIALELLSAACVDKKCREGIVVHCQDWLLEKATTPEKPAIGILAALVLTKINQIGRTDKTLVSSELQTAKLDKVPDFVPMFRDIIVAGTDHKLIPLAIEGLAYLTLESSVKERVADDAELLKRLAKTLTIQRKIGLKKKEEDESNVHGGTLGSTPVFGILSILANITTFPPLLTEQEKKIKEVQAYANSSQPTPLGPLEEEDVIAARCSKVAKCGAVAAFVIILRSSKPPSLNVLRLMSLIILSVTKVHKARGSLAQQGAIKHLLTINLTLHKHPQRPTALEHAAGISFMSALGMARILISVNPATVFDASSIMNVIPPLVALLDPSDEVSPEPSSPRTLAMFESLLGLTNVASFSDDACAAIVKQAMLKLDDILFLNNVLIQRAATELCCNLSTSPKGAAAFLDPDDPSSRARFDVLVALADANDFPTRRAASGALAILTTCNPGVKALLDRKGGVERMVQLCEDDDKEVVIRSLSCIVNLFIVEDAQLKSRVIESLRAVVGTKEVLDNAKGTAGAEDLLEELSAGIAKL